MMIVILCIIDLRYLMEKLRISVVVKLYLNHCFVSSEIGENSIGVTETTLSSECDPFSRTHIARTLNNMRIRII